jgi:probable rRNA maturation factor
MKHRANKLLPGTTVTLLLLLLLRITSAWPVTMFSAMSRAVTRNTRMQKQTLFGLPHFFLPSPNMIPSTCSTPSSTRLFGTKPGPDSPDGEILFDNDQTALTTIDTDRLIRTIRDIRKLLGYETYDVSLLLVEDEEMQETNSRSRGVDAPTDILSFNFHGAVEAGTLMDPDFDIPDYYTLGDMMLDVPYVIRRCQEDQKDQDDDEVERGVSGAMAKVYDPEDRINMLLVHGMLHLVGYDHEEDDEYELMVSKEEEIMKQLGMISEAATQ